CGRERQARASSSRSAPRSKPRSTPRRSFRRSSSSNAMATHGRAQGSKLPGVVPARLLVGLTFHDLRGTAVTRLAIAGATEAEIATITGHSLRSVRAILDTHYLARDPARDREARTENKRSQLTPN